MGFILCRCQEISSDDRVSHLAVRRGGHKSSQCSNRPYREDTCYRCGRATGHSPYDCPHAMRFDGLIELPPPLAPDPLLHVAWSGVRGNKNYWNITETLFKKSRAPPRNGTGTGRGRGGQGDGQGDGQQAQKGKGDAGDKRKRGHSDSKPRDRDDDSSDGLEMWSDDGTGRGEGPGVDSRAAGGGNVKGTPGDRPLKKAKNKWQDQKEAEEEAVVEDDEDIMGWGGEGADEDTDGAKKQKQKKKKKNKSNSGVALADADLFHRSASHLCPTHT